MKHEKEETTNFFIQIVFFKATPKFLYILVLTQFESSLLHILKEIRNELRQGNRISTEANKKFDDEEVKLSEQVDEAIQQNRDINLGLNELNRSVDEE